MYALIKFIKTGNYVHSILHFFYSIALIKKAQIPKKVTVICVSKVQCHESNKQNVLSPLPSLSRHVRHPREDKVWLYHKPETTRLSRRTTMIQNLYYYFHLGQIYCKNVTATHSKFVN